MQDHEQHSPDSRGSPDGRKYSVRQRRISEHEDRFHSPGKSKMSGGLTHYFNFSQTAKHGNSSFHRGNSEVQEAEYPLEKHIEGNYKCQCNICKVENKPKKEEPVTRPVPALDFFNGFDFHATVSNNESEKDFVFVLRKLISPKELPYPLRLCIPETVAFVNGDVKFIALTEKDRRLRFIKNRDKLGLLEIKRFFRESQKRKETEMDLLEERIVHKHDMQSSRRQSVFPSNSKRDKSNQSMHNDSLTRSMILKGKNAKHKEVVHVPTSGRSKNKEVCLMKFKDDTTTVLTEVELDNVLLKRKGDPLWDKIQYMQLYVATKKGMSTMQRVYFVYERDKINPMYERSRREVEYLNGDLPKASQKYIPLHEEERYEEELARTNLKSYYLYILMKVHHFLEVMWNIRITKMGGDFIRDFNGTTWLINISRVHHENVKIEEKSNASDSERDQVEVDGHGNKIISSNDPTQQPLIRMHPKGIGKHDATKVMRRVLRQRPRQNGELNSQDSSATKDFLIEENSPKSRKAMSPTMLLKKNRNLKLSFETASMSMTSSPLRSRNPSRSMINGSFGRSMAVRVNHIEQIEVRNGESEVRTRPKLLFLKNGYTLNEGSILGAMTKSTEIDASTPNKSVSRCTPVHWNEQGSILSSVKNVTPGNISVKMALQHLRHNSGTGLHSLLKHTGSFKEEITKGTMDTTSTVGGHFRERVGEMRIDTNQRFETVDLNQIVMRSSHNQWVKNLNLKIKEKIKEQLRGRRFVKEPKEPNTMTGLTTGFQTAEDV